MIVMQIVTDLQQQGLLTRLKVQSLIQIIFQLLILSAIPRSLQPREQIVLGTKFQMEKEALTLQLLLSQYRQPTETRLH